MQTDDFYEVYPFLTPEESKEIPNYAAYSELVETVMRMKFCRHPEKHRLYRVIGVRCPCNEVCKNCGLTAIADRSGKSCLHCGWMER
jgi:hypothetical protein